VKPLRFACIGCGFIGQRHLRNLALMEGVAVRALVDTDLARAQSLVSHGDAYATSDAAAAFSDPQVDAVVISTWHDTHANLAKAAAAAGKHILLEKPMALTLQECLEIARAAQQAGVVLSLDFKFRFTPAVLEVRKRIPQPVITHGQLAMARMNDDIWVRDPKRGGGLILATACHVLDMIYWLNHSEPVRVYAEGGSDAVSATVRFENGATASLLLADEGENPYAGKWLHEVFDGQRSAVLFDHFRQARFSGAEPEHFSDGNELLSDGTYGIMEDFVCSIRSGRQPVVTARDGIRATLFALRLLDSLRSGKPEELGLDVVA
jgi:myo-inositol 2-dehydrogenase / D-chiro-inositol 1-dehydrogenase